METFPRFWSGKINKFRPLLEKCVSMYPWLLCIVNTISFIFSILMLNLAYWNKNSYRIRIKVRWCRDSILRRKFWKFIPHMHAYPGANLCTPAHNHAHPCTPTPTCTHPRTLSHTCTHPPNTYAYPHTPRYTRTHPGTPPHTRTHPHTSHTYPLMPADALNLINQMSYM